MAITLLAGAFRMAQIEPLAMWTGLFWMRITSAIYFGIGTTTQLFVNFTTLTHFRSFWALTPDQLVSFDKITTLALLSIFLAVSLMARAMPRQKYRRRAQIGSIQERRLLLMTGILFAIPGYFVSYFIVMPVALGLMGNVVLPGVVTGLTLLAPVGFFLLSLWSIRYKPALLPLAGLVLLTDATFAILLFNKSMVLMPLLMLILALMQTSTSTLRVGIAAMTFIGVFQFIEPIAAYGRNELSRQFGNISSGSFSQRLDIINGYFKETGSELSLGDEFQGSIARISFVHTGAPAIYLYDRGLPGDSLSDAFYVLIPRALWPNKPIFDIGARYNQLVNGSMSSQSWMGMFVESYWNFGWFGVPLLMIPLGMLHFFYGRVTQFVMTGGSWLHFPIVFFGLWLGIRVDGSIVGDGFVNVFVSCVYFYLAGHGVTALSAFGFLGSPDAVNAQARSTTNRGTKFRT